MSSDGKDPGTLWYAPAYRTGRNSLSDEASSSDQEEYEDTSYSQPTPVPTEDDAFVVSALAEPPPANAAVNVEEVDAVKSRSTRNVNHIPLTPFEPVSTLEQLWRYVKLFVFPLFFGCLTALIILPPIATGQGRLPAVTFWPLVLIIVAIAFLQGGAVYYTSSLPYMWVLCTITGFLLFLLIGVFALWGPLPGVILFLALLAVAIYALRHSLHPVPEGGADIVFAHGKYSRTLPPGLNFLLPWEEAKHQVNVEEIHWNCPPQKIQLSPEEDVVLRALISYQVIPEQAQLAVTQVKNWEQSLRDIFVVTLQSIADVFTPDDFLNWPQSLQYYHGLRASQAPASGSLGDDFTGSLERRELINNYLLQLVREKVENWGIFINWVSIRDIELVPHGLMPAASVVPATYADHVASTPMATPPATDLPSAGSADTVTDKMTVEQVHAAAAQHLDPQPPVVPIQVPKPEVLIKAYKEVQQGKITDPDTIRLIAARFDALARDTEQYKEVTFDAERAAINLYHQAQQYELQSKQPPHLFKDETRPDPAQPTSHQ